MSERRRGEKRDPSVEREHTRVPARRGGQTLNAEGSKRERTGNWGRDHSDTERTNVGIRIQSRMSDLDDYDRNAHAYRESYLDPPNGYSIGVSACSGLEVPVDPDVRKDLIEEIERERRHEPGPRR